VRLLQSWAMLALLVSAGVAFYALSPPRVRMIDVDAEMAARGIDLSKYMLGPSIEDAIRALGDDPESAIEADNDPELRPHILK
jgi:hypothetical protein